MSEEPNTAPVSPLLPLASPSVVKPVSRIRWGIHLVIIAVLPLAAAGVESTRHARGPMLSHSVGGLLAQCGFALLLFTACFGAAWLASRASWDDLLLRWRPGYWVLPLGAFYSLAIRIAAGVLVAIVIFIVVVCGRISVLDVQKFFLANRPQVENLVDVRALTENPVYYWLNITVVSLLIGGLREELWRSSFLAGLRALWPRIFGSPGGGIAAAAVAALFFGAGHLYQGMTGVILTAFVGFVLGAIMTLHRSIWPSVVAHGLFDATSFAALPWAMRHLQGWPPAPHLGG